MEEIKNIKWEIPAKEIYSTSRARILFQFPFLLVFVLFFLNAIFSIGFNENSSFDILFILFFIYALGRVFLVILRDFKKNESLKIYGDSPIEFYEINESGIYIKNSTWKNDKFYSWNDLKYCEKMIYVGIDFMSKINSYFSGNTIKILDKKHDKILLRINKNQEEEIINEISKKIKIKSI